jgi:hypothetical protein
MPAKTIWEANLQLNFNEHLEPDDPRYHPLDEGRGSFNYNRLYRMLGINPATMRIMDRPVENFYGVFCGHRGCGKSTELRRLSKIFSGDEKNELYFVVFLDASKDLDHNYMNYADIVVALTKRLFESLEENQIPIDPVFLTNLENWFFERVERHETTKEFALEIKSGAKAEAGIPLLAKIFARLTASIKDNSQYKTELRKILKNSFSQFAERFNLLIKAAEEALHKKSAGKKILFIVDGPDQMPGEQATQFFVHDKNQIMQIRSNFIFSAPIHLIYEGSQLRQTFKTIYLPMLMLTKREGSDINEPGYRVFREMIHRRIDPALFDSPDTLDFLIKHSGGCPRELIRLLGYAFADAKGEIFDMESARYAVKTLSNDYRMFLTKEDYKTLYRVDHDALDDNTERIYKLMCDLALMEYNSYWRRSHPVIPELPGYKAISENNKNWFQEAITTE